MKFLDCTLRDGGYYTNWDFNQHVVDNYLMAIDKLPVDCIEVGYRSLSKSEYAGQYFYCPVPTLMHIKQLAPHKKVAIMFNEKDILPEDAIRLLKPIEGLVDIIRLAVQPERFEQAVLLAATIKKMGFLVGINLMYMSKVLKNTSVLEKLPIMKGHVDYFSLVDSYGGVYPDDVRKTVRKVKSLIDIELGFHGHNNLELALINSITAIEEGCTWVDGTITGMGRGAGNLKTELFLTWMANKKNIQIDFNRLADVVGLFDLLQKEYGWGTNLPYMVSGANSLPQKDVMDWLTKRTYSMNSIIQALQNKQSGSQDNLKFPLLSIKEKYQNALLIAGGPSTIEHAEAIRYWINKNSKNVVLIHVSSRNISPFSDLDVPQIYCLVGNEGRRLEKAFVNSSFIDSIAVLPPFPRKMGTYIPDFLNKLTYELDVVSFTDKFQDAHTAISLQTAINLEVEKIFCVGFDGYSGTLIGEKEQDLLKENDYLFKKIEEVGFLINSLTPTKYSSLIEYSIYDLIS